MPEWLGIAIAVLYGTIVGSFLNVCIWRMPRDESIVHPGSHCPSCGTLLRAWDLVPLLSFLVQRCRCRYCGASITWRYFGVELLTGLSFGVLYFWFGWGVDFLAYALFVAALIAIFFIDLEHWIIPDQLSLFGIVVGIGHDAVGLGMRTQEPYYLPIPGVGWTLPVPKSVAGMLICGGIFLGLAIVSYYIFKKEGIGGGDIKLAAAVGANLTLLNGSLWIPLLSFFLAVALGSVIGVALIAARKKTRRDYVPFGPMMVAGAVISLLYGQRIIDAYRQFVGWGG